MEAATPSRQENPGPSRWSFLVFILLVSLPAPGEAGDWQIQETGHYRVESEGDRAGTARISLAMECIHREYSRLTGALPPRRTPDGSPSPRFLVKIFATAESYDRHLREAHGLDASQSYGYFTGDALNSYLEQGQERMLASLFHEGWHQVLRAHMREPPPWLNEGLAEHFETFRFNGSSCEAQASSWENIYTIQHVADAGVRAPSLRDLIGFDRQAYHDFGSGYANAFAWNLAAFLLQDQDQARRQVIPRTIRTCLEHGDAGTATESGFRDLDLDALEAAWRAGYEGKRARKVILITEVFPDTQGARQGLATGDIIGSLDGRSFGTHMELLRAFRALPPDHAPVLEIERDGHVRSVGFEPGRIGVSFDTVFIEDAPAGDTPSRRD